MLQQPGLVILPWSAPAGLDPAQDPPPQSSRASFAWVRQILDLHQAAELGFAGCGPEGSRWLKWWRGRTIEVFEGIDASLLQTIRRPAGIMRMWQVFDAEEKRVGSFYRHVLFDGLGNIFAQLQEERAGRARKFLTRSGFELGAWEMRPDAVGRLTFAEPFNPFVRMNLLAKVLTLPPLPGDLGERGA